MNKEKVKKLKDFVEVFVYTKHTFSICLVYYELREMYCIILIVLLIINIDIMIRIDLF